MPRHSIALLVHFNYGNNLSNLALCSFVQATMEVNQMISQPVTVITVDPAGNNGGL